MIFITSTVLSTDEIDAQNLSSLHWKNLVKSIFHSKHLKLSTIVLNRHLSLPTGATIWDDGEKKGTEKSKRQLVHKSSPFQKFFKQYYQKSLLEFKRHGLFYMMIILSKNHTDRDAESIMPSQVY